MKVLVACEESQRVCIAFREKGHEAYSCDILEPSGGHPEWHIRGDVLKVIGGGTVTTMDGVNHEIGKWDMMIAHPPCTKTSNAGARHLYKGGKLNMQRYYEGLCGKALFTVLLEADIPKVCVENPVPSTVFGFPKPSQIIQPYHFGEPYTKKTCLWLKGLPNLVPTDIVEVIMPWCPSGAYSHKHNPLKRGAAGDKNRAMERSKTFAGIARAMAEQWG